MIVVGLLSSPEEAEELQNIASICSLEDRIHTIVRLAALKKLLSSSGE